MKKHGMIPLTSMPRRFLVLTMKGKNGTKTKMKVRNSCYHIGHMCQIEKYFKEKEPENVGEENATPNKTK